MQKFKQLNEHLAAPIKSWELVVTIASASVGSYTVLSGFFSSFIESSYITFIKLFVIYIVVTIVVLVVSHVVLRTKIKEDEGRETYKYSTKTRKLAKWLRWLFIIGITPFIVYCFYIYKTNKADCLKNQNILSITVTRFSKNKDDEFGRNLNENLKDNISFDDVSIDYPKPFIETSDKIKLNDSLINLLGCHNLGMVVYGSHDLAEKSFYCNIYLHNMYNKCYTVKIKDKVIPIQDPKLIELGTTTTRAIVIGEFIKSMLLAYKCDERGSISLLNDIIRDKDNSECLQLLAYCYLIRGNDLARSNEIDSAVTSYQTGLTLDKHNRDLIANLASMRKYLPRQTTCIKCKDFDEPAHPINQLSIKEPHFKKNDPVFTGGTLKVSYYGQLSNFNSLHFEKSFRVHGITYSFNGDTRVHVKKDSVDKYSYNFFLRPNNSAVFNKFTKKDFSDAACDFWAFDKKSHPITDMKLIVEVRLNFSDNTSLVLDNARILLH